jgi:sigma-B regulation protein RsbU (phosphoserine phosphatase)
MDTAKEVGGDFYDFYFVNEDTLAFLIADVSGKGIPAAMFMMNAKAVLKSYAESGLDVNKVFTLGNEKLCEGNDAGMFVTAWMGFLNTKTGEVTFANAGHNPPLVRHADGSFEYLKARAGFVLAGMEGVKYRKNELQLAPGDVIYLYTDGVTEATNINDELYGEDRLLALLNANKEASMEELCKLVKEDVFAFAGEAPQFDDITMLALKYCGATAPTNQEEAL